MVSSSGAMWKTLRTMFSPGFSPRHMVTLIPDMVDCVLPFTETLAHLATSGEKFLMEEETTKVTVDVIGKVILDADLNCQRSENELLNAFRDQADSLPGNSPLAMYMAWEPRRLLRQARNRRIINGYIRNALLERLQKNGSEDMTQGDNKYVIDMALDMHTAQSHPGGLEKRKSPSSSPAPDPDFIRHSISQMKTFLFAGHDTTSSTITYRLRDEHERVFPGLSAAATAAAIKADPALLSNKSLPYTLAVLWETLRLYPAASAVRSGRAAVRVTDAATGASYPTDGFMVWIVHWAMHRRADLFPAPLEFRPERFLPEDSGLPAPPRDALAALREGPRNCVGQELATLEIKIIMALTVRYFDVAAAYDGPGADRTPWGSGRRVGTPGARMAGTSRGDAGPLPKKQGLELNQVDGERAYQIMIGSAKPKDGFPCRVWRAGEMPATS
ncbi:uncharacterized protein PG998_011759 [Apiospora kogelbergensis]|uniref:uncharacterized protein n=1 Tax=Apiospora kogelbergensis TaxID=1337665 RepID=UPI00312EB761